MGVVSPDKGANPKRPAGTENPNYIGIGGQPGPVPNTPKPTKPFTPSESTLPGGVPFAPGITGANDPAVIKYLQQVQAEQQSQAEVQLPGEAGALQYLTPQERLQYQHQLRIRSIAVAQAKQRAAELRQFAALQHQGPAAVRLQQARLRSLGYNIAVDGNYGPQTQDALNRYLMREQAGLDAKTQATFKVNPLTIRAQTNQSLEPGAAAMRKQAYDYATKYLAAAQQKLDDLKTSSEAPSSLNGGKGGPDYTAALQEYNFIRQLQANALDPNAYDNVTIQDIVNRVQQAEAQAAAEAQKAAHPHRSLFGSITHEALSLVGAALGPINENVFNRIKGAATAAIQEDKAHGGNVFSGLGAGLGSALSFVRIPGTQVGIDSIIAPSGSEADKAIRATNTEEERQALYKAGDILTAGQIVSGRATTQFLEKHPNKPGGGLLAHVGPIGITRYERIRGNHDVISGAFDFGLLSITDPFHGVSKALEPFSEVGAVAAEAGVRAAEANGEVLDEAGRIAAQQAGRDAFLTNTTNGSLLRQGISDVLGNIKRSGNAISLSKALPGLDESIAQKALDAASVAEGGLDAQRAAAQAVIEEAFVKGTYNPTINAIRQFANWTGDKLGIDASSKAAVGLGVGRKAVAMSDRLSFIKNLASPGGEVASTFQTRSAEFVDTALNTTSRVSGSTWRSLWNDSIKSSVSGVGLVDRLWNVADKVVALDKPGLEAAFNGYIKPFLSGEMFSSKMLDSIPLSKYMDALIQQPGFEDAVRKMEVMTALASGDLGDAALRQFEADLRGFGLPKNWLKRVVKDAASNVGLQLPTKAGEVSHDDIVALIKKLPEGDIKDYFSNRLGELQGKGGLRTLQRDVEQTLTNSELRDEIARLIEEGNARIHDLGATRERAGLGQRIVGKVAKGTTDLFEVAPPTEMRFMSRTANDAAHARMRGIAAERFTNAFHLPAAVANTLISDFMGVKTEEEFFAVTKRMVRAALDAKGIEDPEAVIKLLRDRGDFVKRVATAPVRSLDEAGNPVSDLQTLAQRIEATRMPSPTEVAAAVRKAIVDGTQDASVAQRIASTLHYEVSKLGDLTFRFTNDQGQLISIRMAAKNAHRLWKFLVVTNAAMPIVGAVAGFVGAGGNLEDRLKGAGLGFALGSVGAARYVFRVAGIEDRFRIFFADGFTPDAWIPGWANLRSTTRYVEDPMRRFLSDDLTKIGNYGTNNFENDILIHTDPAWGAVARNDSRAPDAWYRIVNHQIHPEDDPVMAILLREQAGHISTLDADRAIKEFLNTEEGAVWKERWKGAKGGSGSAKKAVARMRGFLDRYSTPDIAARRVAGGAEGTPTLVDRATLRQALKDGLGPDEFHAQTSWKFPKSPKQLYRTYVDTIQKGALSGPSNLFNRRPWENSLFGREYDRLVRNGVGREEAQQLADNFATKRVNTILHRFDEPTRFAAKIDYFAPFQHAREDVVRAYFRLAVENPVRTFRIVSYAARAFNNGTHNGLFSKNEFGDWQFTVPGSAWLSQHIFQMPFDVPFTANVRDLLFVGNSGYGGISVLPQPGGPFWSLFSRELAKQLPEVFEGNNPVSKFLFPYGPDGDLLRNDTSRLWMALTGDTPPWEFETSEQWKNQLNRWRMEVGRELMYQERLKGNASYVPTVDEVDEAASHFFKTWAFLGTTFPATSHPMLTSDVAYGQARNAFTLGGVFPMDYDAFLKQHPEFEAYLSGPATKYVGPDDLATLKSLRVGNTDNSLATYDSATGMWVEHRDPNSEDYRAEDALGFRKYKTWSKFRDQFRDYQRKGEYYVAVKQAPRTPLERERYMSNLNKKYADVVGKLNRDYEVVKDLYNIKWQYPDGSIKDGAIQRVKTQFGLTNVELNKFLVKAADPLFMPNPWRDARDSFDVVTDVSRKFGNDQTSQHVVQYVATLSPAEQYRYWQYQMDALGYDKNVDNPNAILDRYHFFQKMYFDVRDKYPWLIRKPKFTPDQVGSRKQWENPFTKLVKQEKADIATQSGAAYNSINQLTAQMQTAAQSKQWHAYYSLKAQRDNIYNYVDALRDKLFHSMPDLTKYYEDLHAATVYDALGNHDEAQQALHQAAIDKHPGVYVRSSQENSFFYMPEAVKSAYIEKLVQALDMPTGKMPYDVRQYVKETTGLTKMFWEYLSPFQQQLISSHMPQYVDKWKYDSDYYLHGPGSASTGGSGGKGFGRFRNGEPSELAYAYELLHKYDRRGGMQKPAAYADYLKLPNNPGAKSAFLDAHPEVKAYLAAGPMSNLPPQYRDFVSNALIKYGGSFGKAAQSVPTAGFLSYEWAKQQLYIWSQRQGEAPASYDLWVNMPTGPAKAQFLEQHPEVRRWIQLGPMSNMPDDYQAIVRDIMQQYGGWTASQDPLGKTITQFYATPGYARDQFLLQHPELEVYWAQTRSPHEQQMFDIENTYFKIQDIQARRSYLAAHPELQQHFVESRTKRYERFLNQVAVYMGANPEIFQDYLTRQTDVLSELLHRFAEPVVLREAAPALVDSSGGTDSGRTRSQAGHPS